MSVLVDKEVEIVESLPLSEVEFCVVDLETTGGSSDYNSITEIGAVKYRAGEEVGRFTTLVNPGCAIPPFIVLLTGITDTMVTNAPAIEDVLDDLLEFIGDAVLVAHNARFDIGFINAALVHDGREKLANRVLDTVGLARRLVGGEVENCKLSTLAASLGFAHQPSHRAINDVLATGDLLHHLIERAAGFGVFDLDDFAAMSKIGTHPQAAKLKMTIDLPRGPGLYLFVDGEGEVLYVGKATNIRARVRSYFGTGDSRRKVGSLLKLMQSIHYISTPDVLSAEVLELRLIARLRPRYNHAFTRATKYCYVRLTCGEVWPRLMVTKSLKSGSDDIFLGPISSRSMARDFVDAIESVVPLRRCTVRMGKNYRAPVDAPVCSAAQLGLAQCPCSGTAEPSSYAEAVESVIKVLSGNADEVLAKLNAKMLAHSRAQRFEEAGVVLARVEALETILRRVQSVRELVDAGELSIDSGQVSHLVERGLLVGTDVDGASFNFVAPQIDLDFSQLLSAPKPSDVSYPISADLIDEILCIARHQNAA